MLHFDNLYGIMFLRHKLNIENECVFFYLSVKMHAIFHILVLCVYNLCRNKNRAFFGVRFLDCTLFYF